MRFLVSLCVLAPGAGSELYRGLGAVVVGGLVFSTLFTLLVVPLLFSLVLDAKAFLLRITSRREDASAEFPASVKPSPRRPDVREPVTSPK